MTTQPKCEDLYLKIAELERRESDLMEKIARTGRVSLAFLDERDEALSREAALAETVALKHRDFIEAQTAVTGWVSKYNALHQRLDASEQRAGNLAELLKASLESVKFDLDKCESREAETYLIALVASIEAQLKGAKS